MCTNHHGSVLRGRAATAADSLLLAQLLEHRAECMKNNVYVDQARRLMVNTGRLSDARELLKDAERSSTFDADELKAQLAWVDLRRCADRTLGLGVRCEWHRSHSRNAKYAGVVDRHGASGVREAHGDAASDSISVSGDRTAVRYAECVVRGCEAKRDEGIDDHTRTVGAALRSVLRRAVSIRDCSHDGSEVQPEPEVQASVSWFSGARQCDHR